ncbi:hypothetical protein ACQY0O_007655 [Thecaphora frezii]
MNVIPRPLCSQKAPTDLGFNRLQDRSSNGLLWNGERLGTTSVLLSEGDRLEVPGSQTGFLFGQLTFGDYEVSNRILGTGSFGKVYLAYDRRFSRQVACKVQSKAMGKEGASGMDLKWEISVLQRVSHPNINGLYDVHDDGVNIRLFLQLVTGGDLFEYIVRERQLPDDVSKFIVYQLANALMYLHSNGIAHRDIKPENILLVRSGNVLPHILLGDFGLAFDAIGRDADDQMAVCIDGTWCAKSRSHVGTPSYLAREAILSRYTGEPYDPFKVDSWSLGVMLFFMLHGIHPFDYGSSEPMTVTRSLVQRQLILDGEIELPAGSTMAEVRTKQKNHPSAPLVQRILHLEIIWPACAGDASGSARELILELLDADPESRRAITDILESDWIRCDAVALQRAFKARVLGQKTD